MEGKRKLGRNARKCKKNTGERKAKRDIESHLLSEKKQCRVFPVGQAPERRVCPESWVL